MAVNAYQPRGAEGTILHGLVRDHLETFLRDAAERTDGAGVPRFRAASRGCAAATALTNDSCRSPARGAGSAPAAAVDA